MENVSPSTIAGYCGLQEVTQKSLAQGSAEIAHLFWNTPQGSRGKVVLAACSKCPAKVPPVPPHPSCPATPSKALTATVPPEPPRYLVGKELLQSLSAQSCRLKLLASLISCLPFHQGFSLSKEVGQKDLAGRNKHKLPFA